MSAQQHQAKRPLTALAGPYGHPFHPILVAVPIGAWVTSLVFDLASLVVPEPAFLARGSLWLIAVGVIGALAAAMFGFLDFLAIPPGTPAFRTARLHMVLNLLVTALYGAAWAWRATGAGTGPVQAGQIALSVVALAALTVSGYLGGKLAYRYGVRVADENTQQEGFRS
ncbi:DUF2231 domain-containing protein [Nonomuraea pusilla]|uniref:Uncharacterized membrane protein n=1 Tax=Nonomuraea pusilla TaxID=46177 RepID=A0A1H8IZH3_9ACTN|nr:DUF2231 domain-containing protein [Nonomuraea pusilla]SEN73128.1 Uncharacterized membrane protein [Nonomuraea pusilla]